MDIEKYLAAEDDADTFWPKKPKKMFDHKQCYSLTQEMLKNIRARSVKEDISIEEHALRVENASKVFNNLRTWLNFDIHMTENQKAHSKDQTFWEHKSGSEGGLFDPNYEIWPIQNHELTTEVHEYLKCPYMQTDPMDFLLIDALMYTEIANYRQKLLTEERLHKVLFGVHRKTIASAVTFLFKWSLIGLGLIFSYHESREVFLLFGLSVIAYQAVKSIKDKPEDEEWSLYKDMVAVYNHTQHPWFNADIILDMCSVVRIKGAIFSGFMYTLLQRQAEKLDDGKFLTI